uniref:PDZ domain-containing protein n=1 Tax=Heliothis virescens TaxID=7102 RepID=A0A2A4JKG6_HELVI
MTLTHTHTPPSAGKRLGLDPERCARAPAVTCQPGGAVWRACACSPRLTVLTPVSAAREQSLLGNQSVLVTRGDTWRLSGDSVCTGERVRRRAYPAAPTLHTWPRGGGGGRGACGGFAEAARGCGLRAAAALPRAEDAGLRRVWIQPAHAEKGKPASTRQVDDGSPAERAGLRRGDRILEVNGHSIARREPQAGGGAHQGAADDASCVAAPAPGDPVPALDAPADAPGARDSPPPAEPPRLNLHMTAAEMRAHLAAKKKFDPKKVPMDLKSKFDIVKKL